LAIDIFPISLTPLTSAVATKFIAEGVVGINIKTNHGIGSSENQLAFVAMAQVMAMEELHIHQHHNAMFGFRSHWPDHESRCQNEQG
jgi:hypothetical protein